MIIDTQTNFVFLSDKLHEKYPEFSSKLTSLFDHYSINHETLQGTRDIWAVDYMPVQVDDKQFVQFRFDPDYLREYPADRTLSTEITKICDQVKESNKRLADISIKASDIILDGGNVVRGKNKVIICDKVFHENECYTQKQVNELIQKLKQLLHVEEIIFVPWDTDDYTGHADAMVRFINDEKVLINEYSKHVDKYAQIGLRTALHNAGLTIEELSCFLPDDPTYTSARGLYLNYLQMEQAIFMPVFNLKDDERAYQTLQSIFPEKPIVSVACSDIAREGGILNCLTWNIKAP